MRITACVNIQGELNGCYYVDVANPKDENAIKLAVAKDITAQMNDWTDENKKELEEEASSLAEDLELLFVFEGEVKEVFGDWR